MTIGLALLGLIIVILLVIGITQTWVVSASRSWNASITCILVR